MISIVLPSYNGEKYIAQSIESVLRQTYSDWELIIVDDCSTDSTREIAEEYSKKDSRIRVVHNEANKKLPMSLNVGFEHANGQLYTWTSDDNAYAPNALEKMKQVLEKNHVDFVYADYEAIDPDDYIIYYQQTGPSEELPLKDTVGACFLYKKEIQEVLGGYNPNKFLVEDYDFWIRAYWKYKFLHMDESLYYYRIHASSLTAERAEEVKKATVKLLKENIENIDKKDVKLIQKVQDKINQYYK